MFGWMVRDAAIATRIWLIYPRASVSAGMVKFLLRRVRRFMQAEVMEELVALHAEIAALRRETMLREDVRPVIRQMEAALLAIALSKSTANERIGRHEVLGERTRATLAVVAPQSPLKKVFAPLFSKSGCFLKAATVPAYISRISNSAFA